MSKRIEGLPLYKAVDLGERFADVVIEVDYIPASVSDLVEALLEQGALMEEQATAYWAALTAEERSAMPPNIRRFVTEWERLPGSEE